MQRHAVAFGITNDRAETVRPDRVLLRQDQAAVRFDLRDGIVQAAMTVEIDEDALVGGFGIGRGGLQPDAQRSRSHGSPASGRRLVSLGVRDARLAANRRAFTALPRSRVRLRLRPSRHPLRQP